MKMWNYPVKLRVENIFFEISWELDSIKNFFS